MELNDVTDRLINILRELALQLHPHRKSVLRAGLDSRLDRDMGFDSLGRVELMVKLERAFRVRLPEELVAEAETPRDLLEAILKAAASTPLLAPTEAPSLILPSAEPAPDELETLTEVLAWHVGEHPHRPHIVLAETITYRALDNGARAVAGGLRHRGLERGERVAIMLPTGEAFFRAFFGTLFAGGIPVPIYPPMRISQLEDHLRRQAKILNNAGAAILITVPQATAVANILKLQVESLRAVETVNGLSGFGSADAVASRPEDTALLQYTSGSTGDPKGVVLSHANLLANIRAMGQVVKATSSDVLVSWLPLYHDMGLIGAWLGALYFAVPTVIISPITFLARPERWLWAIHQHRGTLSASPNFGFELCLRKIDDRDLEGLSLSSLRMVMNGAEQVSPTTIRQFTERFAKFGFRPEAMAPVYGLAESSVGLSFPPPGRLPIINRIQREPFTGRGDAVPAAMNDANVLEFVACGLPLPGHQIRVVDSTGYEVGQRREGKLQFRGPSATSGYFRNADKTRELIHGEWRETGDLAYIADGDIFITGRLKDIIIRAGRNIYPQEVEEAVGNIQGVRKGCVALCGIPDRVSGTERIMVFAEAKETGSEALSRLRQHIDEVVADLLATPPDDVLLLPPHTLPKTSSGKIRRAACRELYESGRLIARPPAMWLQLARLTFSGLWSKARLWRRAIVEVIYAAYWWGILCAVAAVTWTLVILLPLRAWRWVVIRAAARLFLRLTVIPLSVEGREPWVPGGRVVVTNHCSYLDSLVLSAALPGELVFAARHDLGEQFFAGRFLRRIDTLFVKVFDTERTAEDTRKAIAAVEAGRPLVFYPEGTLTRRPGLMAFHLGAFLVAAKAGIPVTPVTIRGTRSILRGEQWFPRRGAVKVMVAAPLKPEGSDWAAAIRLRDLARAEILSRCAEPDLAEERIHF